ncbi:MAG: hypothetical protein WCX47_02320 [Bacilli bacterium]|jgi:hypothetical protein|nr:hypothetical protein [Bacilli bacterium]MDD3388810.1 hypothetical protein [Bacilli bacterium]MDD4344600.1 hypothetical protein [Bacilli bacterium]MDD4520494.1 hypothetical protein [Bacilli bacterium]MDY0399091.1 hypothetical protein [Bacilli bacterium]
MKDKLVKLNRKARYYRTRNSLFSLAGVVFLGLGVALPVAAKAKADAETSQVENSSEELTTDQTGDDSSLLVSL